MDTNVSELSPCYSCGQLIKCIGYMGQVLPPGATWKLTDVGLAISERRRSTSQNSSTELTTTLCENNSSPFHVPIYTDAESDGGKPGGQVVGLLCGLNIIKSSLVMAAVY